MRAARASGRLVVQPRMGFGEIEKMRAGLEAVRNADCMAVGTITLDSYTRVGDHEAARQSLALGQDLNGFPLVTHGAQKTREMLRGIQSADFPIQVRHGCSLPYDIFVALIETGIDATEGGPVSYCLPYGRTPLQKSIDAWARCCDLLSDKADDGQIIHLESFGGCLLGQLCPPSLLIAISVLECMFFQQHGVRSVSLSYAQQTNLSQDLAALAALRRLATERLTDVEWHVVLYTYMGVFPKTKLGALDILGDSVYLALKGGADRLIVKTPAEAHRIPTVAENIGALEHAERIASWSQLKHLTVASEFDGDIYIEARALIESVLELDADIGCAMQLAFKKGYLDVPYCLHADNAGRSRSFIDQGGVLRWQSAGSMALQASVESIHQDKIKSKAFLQMLSYVEHRFDAPHLKADRIQDTTTSPAATHLQENHSASKEKEVDIAESDGHFPDVDSPYTIAIVGMGPRGVAILEHLVLNFRKTKQWRKVRILAIDDVQVGAGRIWRTDQPDWFMMNTLVSQITMYSGAPDHMEARPGAGPSLYEWLATQSDPALPKLGVDDYAPRVVYGKYLKAVYQSIISHLPPNITVQEVKSRVVGLRENAGTYTLTRENDSEIANVNKVILTTGHPQNQLEGSDLQFRQFADLHPQLTFISGDSSADMPLHTIASGCTVGLIGMGLGFFDVLLSLTVGRGGQFVMLDNKLQYRASGREPRIVSGSRGGAPIFARGVNQKKVGAGYQPLFITPKALKDARMHSVMFHGTERLDFAQHVLPLIQSEVEHVYYKTHVRLTLGAIWAEKFAIDHEQLVLRGQQKDHAFLKKYALDAVAPIDLHTLARPFEGQSFASHEVWTRALLESMHDDLVEAKRGNVDGPLKAALDVLRDVRDIIRTAVDFGGLELKSYRDDFLGSFAPICSILAAGPPLMRVEQAIALIEAGILEVIGPDARFECDGSVEQYRVRSPHVEGATRLVTVLVDSRIPGTRLQHDKSALMQSMLQSGFACSYTRDDGDNAHFDTGGLAVTDSPFNVLAANGQPHLNCYALGIPTEHTRWFTQVGSDTPNAATRFGRDAEAIAADILKSLAAHTITSTQASDAI